MHLSDEYPIKFESERLPPPIVTDLNGDGKKEVLVATPDAKIQVQFHLFNMCYDDHLQFDKNITNLLKKFVWGVLGFRATLEACGRGVQRCACARGGEPLA